MPDNQMKGLVDRLRVEHHLSGDEYRLLLINQDRDVLQYLQQQAQDVALRHFGPGIYIRGLIEVTNCCRNDCFYCGIRRSNRNVTRYLLTPQQILDCCEQGYRLGFRTFVLQGGEQGGGYDEQMVQTVAQIRKQYPDCGISLSLGEKPREVYRRLYDAGANRYLLRHETICPDHYRFLHPTEMSLDNRVNCLHWLQEIGYQVGTGIMVGSPGQVVENLVTDLLFIYDFKPHMIGIGPFIPHADTPFSRESAGCLRETLTMISILRLMFPHALIPATTALATLAPNGRERGILAGANVVMPNLSPVEQRANYSLYNNKASLGAESAEGLVKLEAQLTTIGYHINYGRGDYSSDS